MKVLLIAILALTAFAFAQTPAPAVPKRPLGVPADAKHFNGRWYKVVLEKKSWHAARDKCKEMGGQLVTVPDAATWEFVKGLGAGRLLWIGATDEVTARQWLWVDGSRVVFSAWTQGQPDNRNGTEHYAIMGKTWADVERDQKSGQWAVVGFICEWRAR
jgi:hypothetical protein